MRKRFSLLGGAFAAFCLTISPAHADDDDDDDRQDSPFQIEAEVEIGYETVFDADDPDEEYSDVFVSAEVELEYALSDSALVFAGLGIESVLDAEGDHVFSDLGLYVSELGFRFSSDALTLSFGKISPPFGSAWDTAPGYFGAAFAEDYEIEEVIGLAAEFDLGPGTLTTSAFFADTTALSDSLGTQRGRLQLADGGVGNTGTLNNFALQYDAELGDTTLHAGLRHLSRGQGDTDDERAFALGATHSFESGFGVMAEVAIFRGWEGTSDDATIATIGASFEQGPFGLSLALARRDITGAEVDHMASIGLDYAFDAGPTLSAGLIMAREEGERSNAFGISLAIPLGR